MSTVVVLIAFPVASFICRQSLKQSWLLSGAGIIFFVVIFFLQYILTIFHSLSQLLPDLSASLPSSSFFLSQNKQKQQQNEYQSKQASKQQ